MALIFRLTRLLCFVLIAARAVAQSHPATGASETSFEEAARVVTAAIQRDFHDENTGLYAQSRGKREPAFMWGNGVMFSTLVAAARHEPATYRPLMQRFFAALDRYWDKDAAVPGYEPSPTRAGVRDKYYDDNEWMAITFLEAYELTHDAKYLDRAEQTLKFALSGWDDQLGGGIWWHELHKDGSKNTCSNAPAAVACLRLARCRAAREYVPWARKLVEWTDQNLRDDDGLFFDARKAADGHVDQRKFTYNSALMLRANLGLYRATGEEHFLAEAKRIGAACQAFVDEKSGAYRDGPVFSHLLVEADLELYRATGDGELLTRARREGGAAWARWQKSPPKGLLDQAAIARTLWLLADQETQIGREFWAKADAVARETVDP